MGERLDRSREEVQLSPRQIPRHRSQHPPSPEKKRVDTHITYQNQRGTTKAQVEKKTRNLPKTTIPRVHSSGIT